MIIVKDIKFSVQLLGILKYIAEDKKSAAIKFERELNALLNGLLNFPLKHRASYYMGDEAYRDLIYMGYTIIYKVETDKILILEMFKWQNR
jgi:plasmid stabilization system protein ParE